MGRPRKNSRHLPKYVTLYHGSYYYRNTDRKRVRLGRELDIALARYARLFEADGRIPARELLADEQYVYVIGIADWQKPVKIGIASDVAKRLMGLQTAQHLTLEVKASYLFSPRAKAAKIEEAAHQHFAATALRGEWFDVAAPEVVAWIDVNFGGAALQAERAMTADLVT